MPRYELTGSKAEVSSAIATLLETGRVEIQPNNKANDFLVLTFEELDEFQQKRAGELGLLYDEEGAS